MNKLDIVKVVAEETGLTQKEVTSVVVRHWLLLGLQLDVQIATRKAVYTFGI